MDPLAYAPILAFQSLSRIFDRRVSRQDSRTQGREQQTFQRELFEARRDEERRQAEERRAHEWALATRQRETALGLQENQKILDHWPLKLFPSQILHAPRGAGDVVPLKVLLSPPSHGPRDLDGPVRQRLQQFVATHYPLTHPERPVELLDGVWKDGDFQGAASIKTLHERLRSEPTLVIETQLPPGDEDLYLNLAYWGPAQDQYFYQPITKVRYAALLQTAARDSALEWQQARERLIQTGLARDVADADQRFGGTKAFNLARLAQEDALRAAGIPLEQVELPPFQFVAADYAAIHRFLISWGCLAIGWVADLYHFAYWETSPRLPTLLPELLDASFPHDVLPVFLDHYGRSYQALAMEQPVRAPELTLLLAEPLAALPDLSWSRAQTEWAVRQWLALRGVDLQIRADESAIEILIAIISGESRLIVEPSEDGAFRLSDATFDGPRVGSELLADAVFLNGLRAVLARLDPALDARLGQALEAVRHAPISDVEQQLTDQASNGPAPAVLECLPLHASEARNDTPNYGSATSARIVTDLISNTSARLDQTALERFRDRWDWWNLSESCSLPWTKELIARHVDQWDWDRLSKNRALPWSEGLIASYSNRWNWSELSSNTALPWTKELLERYEDRWNWLWDGLSKNEFLPWAKHLIDYYESRWAWGALSSNKSIPWNNDLIAAHAEKWSWQNLGGNLALPWTQELIAHYEDCFFQKREKKGGFFSAPKIEIKASISGNKKIPWSEELIAKYQENLEWKELSKIVHWTPSMLARFLNKINFSSLSLNENMVWTPALIERFAAKLSWGALSINESLPWDSVLIARHESKWSWYYLSSNKSLPWSEDLIERHKECWDWQQLSLNRAISWSENLIDKYSSRLKCSWNWKYLIFNESIPWTETLAEKYSQYWDWKTLSTNNTFPWTEDLIARHADQWDWSALSRNRGLPWTEALIERYTERWDWGGLSENPALWQRPDDTSRQR